MQGQEQGISEYLFATIDARPERGGRVKHISSPAKIHKNGIAVVGDAVTYDDGSQARIIDGAGFRITWCDKPVALVGSSLDNGDKITATPHNDYGITVEDGEIVPGLFDPTWTPSKRQDLKQAGGNHD